MEWLPRATQKEWSEPGFKHGSQSCWFPQFPLCPSASSLFAPSHPSRRLPFSGAVHCRGAGGCSPVSDLPGALCSPYRNHAHGTVDRPPVLHPQPAVFRGGRALQSLARGLRLRQWQVGLLLVFPSRGRSYNFLRVTCWGNPLGWAKIG